MLSFSIPVSKIVAVVVDLVVILGLVAAVVVVP